MTIYSLWDINNLTIVVVLFLIEGLSMSGTSRVSSSHNKLWDIKKENREIFVLYTFLELNRNSFVDIFKNDHKHVKSLEKNGAPAGCIMTSALENACLDFAYYIREKNINTYNFTYKGIDFNFNYMDCLLSNEQFDAHCAKAHFLQIYDCISLRDDVFSSLTINNVRLVNFVWSYLRLTTDYRNNRYLSINHIDTSGNIIQDREIPYIYNNLKLIKTPSDPDTKIVQIKKFFDLLDKDKNKKEVGIKFILDQWGNVKDDKRIVDWLNNIESRKGKLNEEGKKEIIDWAWRHIKTKYYNKITPEWGGIDDDASTSNTQQQKENIITFFDLMTNEAIKSSIISELKTSTSKAKYKILNNKKTHLNTPISEKTKSKFDALKKYFNFSNEEMIISLIDDRYEKINMHGTNIDN